ncbi:SLBB domain-containing protein [Gammaproteobacteria bacterium]|nr:SLBB domain-containing protein [Gammaproteobacteria bacterium]
MKIKYYFFTLFFSSFILSQSIDDKFLESLPENIQQDLLSEASKNNDEDIIYRSPNTRQELPLQTVNRLVSEIEELKKKYTSTEIDSNELKRFGDGFFSSIQSSFMPINDPSFSNGYIINPGDKIRLQIVGPQSSISDFEVEREGSINIPNIGKFYLAGLELKEADKMLKEAISLKLPGSNSFLTLTGIGDIQILMVGNIKKPGIYTINGNSNILHALDVSGGIANNGSYRDISIKRNNNIIASVDLYDVFINGNTKQDFNLRSGDTILVGAILPTVAISGAISNPAIYEIKEKSLSSLIEISNGLTHDIDSERNIIITRKNQNSLIEVSLNKNSLINFEILPGDNIYIPQYSAKPSKVSSVTIKGQINQPGTYTLDEGETLSNLLNRAGGYKSNAYTIGAILSRESLKKLEEEINERIYKDLIKYIINTSSKTAGGNGGESGLPLLLSEFKDTKPVGRMPAEFDLDVLEQNQSKDIQLQDGDSIFIPSMPTEVYVFGEVMNPGSRIYDPKFGFQSYINESGGLTNFALDSHIIIVSPDGIAQKAKRNLRILSESLDILPGTMIYVPRQIGKRDNLEVTALMTNVFSSLAISLASLNSITTN